MMAKYKYRKTFYWDGRQYDVKANTEQEAYIKLAQKKLELEQNKVKESNVLVSEYLERWRETFKEPYVAGRTNTMYIYAIKAIVKYIGTFRMKDVTSTDIQNIITAEMRLNRSKSHIDKVILTLKQSFRRAVIDRYIQFNPTEGMLKPKMIEKTRRAVTDAEREVILAVAETNIHGRWIRAMLYLGLRPSETALVQGKDINLDIMELHVRGSKSAKSDRRIPIPEIIIDDFRGFRPNEYVFATQKGNPPTERRMRGWWEAFKRDMDIYMGAPVYRNQVIESKLADDLVLYCLRHTYGTDAVGAGVPIATLSELMGHADIRTTKKYYVDPSYEARQTAREMFNNFYNDKD